MNSYSFKNDTTSFFDLFLRKKLILVVCISFWFVANFCCKSVNEMQHYSRILSFLFVSKSVAEDFHDNHSLSFNLPSAYSGLILF